MGDDDATGRASGAVPVPLLLTKRLPSPVGWPLPLLVLAAAERGRTGAPLEEAAGAAWFADDASAAAAAARRFSASICCCACTAAIEAAVVASAAADGVTTAEEEVERLGPFGAAECGRTSAGLGAADGAAAGCAAC